MEPGFLPFQVDVRQLDDEFLELYYMWEGQMKSLTRGFAEPMAKALMKMTAGSKKKKKKGKKMKPVTPEDIEALRKAAAEETVSDATVRSADGTTIDTKVVLNIEGWTTGTTILLQGFSEKLTVIKDPPTVESVSTFPGDITKGNKLKSTGLMVGYPAIALAMSRNADKLTYLWYRQGKVEDPDYVFAGEGPIFIPTEDHIGLKLKVFVTAVDSSRGGLSGRSVVSYLPGAVRPQATPGILLYRAGYLAIREKLPPKLSNDEDEREEDEASIGKDFLPLFSAANRTMESSAAYEPDSLSNKSGYLQLKLPVKLCEHPLVCKTASGQRESEDVEVEVKALRVVSFNILADCYCSSDFAINQLFRCCDPTYLSLDYRLQLVGAELKAYDADIVCLQEVDKKAFNAFLSPFMSSCGYTGHFTMKHTSTNEGCATFTKRGDLEVVLRVDLALGKSMKECGLFDEAFSKLPQAEEILVGYLGMIGQVTVVRRHDSQYVVVGNTHQFYHPRAAYARLLQTFVITHCLGAVAEAARNAQLSEFKYPGATIMQPSDGSKGSGGSMPTTDTGHPQVSALFLGDLNSTLETAVVEYLETGVIASDHQVWASVQDFDWHRQRGVVTEDREGEEENEAVEQSLQGDEKLEARAEEQCIWPELRNPLGAMCSASGYPQFTNFTEGFKDVLDYIFIPAEGPYAHLKTIRIAPMPSELRLSQDCAIPSSTFPSDHLALAVDLVQKE